MRCAWATPPKRMLRGLRAYQKVNVQASELTCDLSGEHSEYWSPASTHPLPDTVAPKTQTTSTTTARFQRFSSRWSALWAPHHLKPRSHRHQTGEMTSLESRHADSQPLMLQNPHRHRRGGHRKDRRARSPRHPWAAGPGLPQKSHAIRLGEDSTRPKNVAISTL